MNPFDFVKNINLGGSPIDDEAVESDYVPWLTNMAFSYHVDTILYANEANMMHEAPKTAQYRMLKNGIRPGKRFAKWHKMTSRDEIRAVAEFFGVGLREAQEYVSLLTTEQKQTITEYHKKGIEHDQN